MLMRMNGMRSSPSADEDTSSSTSGGSGSMADEGAAGGGRTRPRATNGQKIIKMFGMLPFLTSKHEFQRIKYSNSVRFRK